MLANIRIVLVQTFHPGNIGSAARAMKTMGLNSLTLVNPRAFPDPEAARLAAGAQDILDSARVVDSVAAAVSDCVQAVGASARLRSLPLPHYDEPEAMAADVVFAARADPVALVFGRERFGLTGEEIRCCSHQVSIPASPDYGILNLSQAVQVLTYELHQAWRRTRRHPLSPPDTAHFSALSPATARQPSREQMEHFYRHLGCVMHRSGFLTQPHARTEEHLRALFARAQPTRKELSLLRGLLASVEQHFPKE